MDCRYVCVAIEVQTPSLRVGNVRVLLLLLSLATFIGCGSKVTPTPVVAATVVKEYPHDAKAFTQGLVVHNGVFYEGTGQYGKSALRKVQISDGKLLQQLPLDASYFGEGITILQNKIFQLTWQNNTCFVYDLESMRYEKSFTYTYEGWGLTNNGKELIVSDGTAYIRFVDSETFEEKRKIQVVDANEKVKKLNELEWVDGEIWANIWYEDRIARISPETGKIVGWIDLKSIYPMVHRDREAVMNGIAYDPSTKQLFVTGKNWPKVFEVQVKRK